MMNRTKKTSITWWSSQIWSSKSLSI